MRACLDKSALLYVLFTTLAPSTPAQTVQEVIELDRQIAVQKRKADLAEAKRRFEAVEQRPIRPLVAPEPRRPEEDFQVRGVYGPLTNLVALVSYRGDIPVALGMAPPHAQALAGWSIASMTPEAIVLERLPPTARSSSARTSLASTERLVLPVRLTALPSTADMKGPLPLPQQGPQIFGAPISPVIAR